MEGKYSGFWALHIWRLSYHDIKNIPQFHLPPVRLRKSFNAIVSIWIRKREERWPSTTFLMLLTPLSAGAEKSDESSDQPLDSPQHDPLTVQAGGVLEPRQEQCNLDLSIAANIDTGGIFHMYSFYKLLSCFLNLYQKVVCTKLWDYYLIDVVLWLDFVFVRCSRHRENDTTEKTAFATKFLKKHFKIPQ